MPNRFFAKWAPAARNAAFAQILAIVALVHGFWDRVDLNREKNKPMTVIRTGADGVANAVTLTEVYSEPNESELRWFATEFAVRFMLGDSFSIRQDYVFCRSRMTPELADRFMREAKGDGRRTGVVFIMERLAHRTHVPRESIEIVVDKRPWPWQVVLKGERQVMDEHGGVGSDQKWQVQLDVVRAPRTIENPSGLLVQDLHSGGSAVIGPSMERVYAES